MRDIASLFDMAATTVVTIRKDKDKIIASAKNATPLSAKIVTKHRPAIMEDMERLLSLWVDDMSFSFLYFVRTSIILMYCM